MKGESEFYRTVQKRYVDNMFKAFNGERTSAEDLLNRELALRRKPDPKYSLSNIVWLTVAALVFYWSDFYLAIRYDPRIDRFWFNLGLLALLVGVTIGGFLIIYVSWIQRVHSDQWEEHYPAAIPVATACFCFSAVFLLVGLWPLWRYFTPFILFSQLMGAIVFVAMLPDC